MKTTWVWFVPLALLLAGNCSANYWGFNGIVQNQTYQVEFTPRIAQNTTYWATMSVSSIGGYGGIQQWYSSNPATDHVGLYSIWDSTDTSKDSFVIGYNPSIMFNNYSFRFGGEGTGAQLSFRWPWLLAKTYRMAWRRYIEPDNAVARYEGFYFDPYDTNALGWIWVGTIRKPVATDSARNMQGFEGFAEAYGGNLSQVREIDIRNVWLLDLSNRWMNITAANWTDSRDPSLLTPIPGGWRHRCFDSNDIFTAANNLPMLPGNDLAPLFLPYRINCGWGSTNVATGMQVASSLNRAFEPDAFWYGISATNFTATAVSVAGVSNAAPALLYQSRREGTNFGYKFFGLQPITPCLVRLHFAETDFNSVGARVQAVLINGTIVESNLDVRASASAQNKALVRDYYVNAGTNGILDISFQSQAPGIPAIVSGIEANGLLPQLAWHPQSVTNNEGSTAQFGVTVVGAPPLSYQWRKIGVALAGATNNSLTLSNVLANNAGNYDVIVTNNYGSVTSSVAVLTVTKLSLFDGLVAYYPFNGNANDESGNGRHGVVLGATLAADDRFGRGSNAYHFDDIDDGIRIGSSPVTGQLTIAAWIFKDGDSTTHDQIVCVTNAGGVYFSIFPNSNPSLKNHIDFGANYSSTDRYFSTNPIPVNAWVHVVATYDGQWVRLYQDGSLAKEALRSGGFSSGMMYIGRDGPSAATDVFRGVIDDVRIYNRALSQSEVAGLFSAELTLPRPSISQPQITMDNQFSVLIAGGEVGRLYRVQTSTNLSMWSDATNFVSTINAWQFSDPMFTNYPRRFYRVVSQ